MPTPKLSQEEIAKQFQLPERKSKIATLLKQDEREYCICNSKDSSRFMIGCDLCDRWYHGNCIGITEKDSKNIKRYYCIRCQSHDSTLKTVYKSSSKSYDYEVKRESHTIKGSQKKEELAVYTPPKKKITKGPCGSCANCRKSKNCGSCNVCKRIQKSGARRIKEKCLSRVCIKLKPSIGVTSKHRDEESSSDEERLEAHTVGISVKPGMQCYGPGCVETARPNSKYCSDRCGMKLATNRIYQVLPQRLQEWSLTPSHAETINKKELEAVRQKQIKARTAIHELDKRHQLLETIIAQGKTLEPCFSADSEQAQRLGSKKSSKKGIDKEEEASIYCVTCGHEIHTSSAIKHMEKCFNKYESQASFGSMYKTRIEGNSIFCDFYNPVTNTYCKRLLVLCPEHTKDPVIGNNEACGCPLIRNVFEETNELCDFPKKVCFKHHCWEKIRRAEIDLERVREWLKLDELIEEERQLRRRLVERAGVLGLMLHSTYDHDAMETMSSAQEEERVAQLEQTLRKNYNKEQFENLSKENKRLVKTLKKTLNS